MTLTRRHAHTCALGGRCLSLEMYNNLQNENRQMWRETVPKLPQRFVLGENLEKIEWVGWDKE